jgi:hypothetical protein
VKVEEYILGSLNVSKELLAIGVIDMCSREHMRIGYNFIPIALSISQYHTHSTCQKGLTGLINSCIYPSKTRQNLSFHLLGIKASCLTKLTTREFKRQKQRQKKNLEINLIIYV